MGVNANDTTAAAPAAKKYHLVEAEEVDQPKTQPRKNGANATAAGAKKKGKVNWTQFPLGSEDGSSGSATENDDSSQRNGFRGERGGRFNGAGGRGGRGPRRNYDNNGAYYNGVYVPNTDPKMTAQWAKEQIEFYFSPDNLVRDIFLRQHMDVDGYVPLAFVGSFQAVYSVHQDYASLLEAVKSSESVELDLENEKVRLRDGWQKWLWPNADGGYGVPRYIKTADEDASESA
uniref:HTH La-type RNA-binding domain-containing protein n=1 Tax=Globisporangium ultimum (strain ATCC 200006 / CBS 805.95 / DAOM BR144) TaxID=431595 RepID=K3W5C3_GLOUD